MIIILFFSIKILQKAVVILTIINYDSSLFYAIIFSLLTPNPSNREEGNIMIDIIISFSVSVAAIVAAHYICKWMDRYTEK